MEICVTFAIFYIGMFYVQGMTLYYLCKKKDNGVVANIKPVYFVWMDNFLVLHVLNVTRGHINRVRKYIKCLQHEAWPVTRVKVISY